MKCRGFDQVVVTDVRCGSPSMLIYDCLNAIYKEIRDVVKSKPINFGKGKYGTISWVYLNFTISFMIYKNCSIVRKKNVSKKKKHFFSLF